MPKLILVVDDELQGLRVTHVQGVVPNFYEVLSDTTDPRFESLLGVARTVSRRQREEAQARQPQRGGELLEDVDPRVADDESAAVYFASDNAVQDLLLSAEFAAGASPELKELVSPFLARAQRVDRLRADFLSAFPQPDFEVQFVGAPRPTLDGVVRCAAVFFDLFLEDGAFAPVDALQQYLKTLVGQAGDAVLPPMVVMSLHAELNEHKRKFSERAGISAAGLMVLPKDKISEPQFGAVGLRLSFDQLSRQSGVAHSMRLFISSWQRALDRATDETSKTLWNLDASAMQQIHLASVSDDDPYDEHLNELLSREYLFRVEADSEVGAKIEQLDMQFRQHLSPDGRDIGNRLIAPLTDVGTSRSLMSHFTWLGSRPAQSFIADTDEECAVRVSRSLPFGSVLCGPALSNEMKCLLHITQQCDLNGISRAKDPSGTLVFAMADARELQESDNPITSTADLVARSLQISEGEQLREFDLRVNVGELLAMPLREFVARAREHQLRVIGRMRSDITNQIVAATSNHMSRPASQKMLRPGMLRSKIFVQSTVLPNGWAALIESGRAARVFSLTQEKDLFSFQDDACVEISLWLARQLSDLGKAIDVDPLCTTLRRGWRSDRQLAGVLKVKVVNCADFNRASRALVATDVANDAVQLTVVCERAE